MMFKEVFVVIFLLIVILVKSNPTSKCGIKNAVQGNVFGGDPTKSNTWPWIVAFIHRKKAKKTYFCGGSLVSAKHVVSAAHCFQVKHRSTLKYPQDVTALIGVHNLSDPIEVASAVHKVWQVILHEDWDWNSSEYDADISLVVLETQIDLSDPLKIGIVCLPTASDGDYEGVGTVVGWGISEASEANREHFDSTPNEIRLPAVTRSQCEEAGNDFHAASSDRTFCAGYVMQGKSACGGDSGGGFLAYDKLTKSYNLAGIVSSSPIDRKRSCNIDTYSIFTNVGKFVEWITKNMEETEEIKWKNVKFGCENLKDSTFFNCSHNFTGLLTRILKIHQSFESATETRSLKIYFNPSTHIFAGLGENFPNLHSLTIRDQSIKFVERKNFFGMQKLNVLSLAYNQIEVLPEDVFMDLPNLWNLYLSNNLIMELPEKLFTHLSSIKAIDFQNNHIKTLPSNLFLNNLGLKYLGTYNNPLTTNDFDSSVFPNVKLYNETYKNYYHQGKIIQTVYWRRRRQ